MNPRTNGVCLRLRSVNVNSSGPKKGKLRKLARNLLENAGVVSRPARPALLGHTSSQMVGQTVVPTAKTIYATIRTDESSFDMNLVDGLKGVLDVASQEELSLPTGAITSQNFADSMKIRVVHMPPQDGRNYGVYEISATVDPREVQGEARQQVADVVQHAANFVYSQKARKEN